jgi:DNA adenine methylase
MGCLLPRRIDKVHVPPLKIQGIKTKLVPFIADGISWSGKGTWYEPFMGSGCVGFNICPEHAVFCDVNPHIISFYTALQSGEINAGMVRAYLEHEASLLANTPADKNSYYYQVRDRFNDTHQPLDFLFLQRSNFNGMIRFGPHGYNVPFGRKPDRFRPALITKIVHQVEWLTNTMDGKDWEFRLSDWSSIISELSVDDFVYLDPPYIGRNADYYTPWDDDDAQKLTDAFKNIPCGYALSMWYKNKYRTNTYLDSWNGTMLTSDHYYYLGGHENNRNSIIEALLIKQGYSASMVNTMKE